MQMMSTTKFVYKECSHGKKPKNMVANSCFASSALQISGVHSRLNWSVEWPVEKVVENF